VMFSVGAAMPLLMVAYRPPLRLCRSYRLHPWASSRFWVRSGRERAVQTFCVPPPG
jgi:hypothetical protein